MKLTKNDIKKMTPAGSNEKGNQVYHIECKGGLHIMAEKTPGGEFKILGNGNHRAFAKSTADKMQRIQWDETLFKSEKYSKMKKSHKHHESSPDKHYEMAKWHSGHAAEYKPLPQEEHSKLDFNEKHDRTMRYLYHTDEALGHYKASGLNYKNAKEHHAKHIEGASEKPPSADPPYNGEQLKMSYQKKYDKKFPSGTGYDYTK